MIQGKNFLPSEFRRKLSQPVSEPLHEIGALFTKPGTGLLYEQSVAAFVRSFEQEPATVLADMKEIWQTDGFIPIDRLTDRLVRRYSPDISDEAAELLFAQINKRYHQPEPLTGLKRKQHAPLMTGLSHLFGVMTDQKVSLIVGDYSNMGMTNLHFGKLIAARDGVPLAQVPDTSYKNMTDQAARAISGLAREKLATPGVLVSGFRTGGDEICFVTVGMDSQFASQLIHQQVMPAIEEFNAKAGLMQHEHGKALNDRFRAGFGVAFHAMPLDVNTHPGSLMEIADKALTHEKEYLGMARRGRINIDVMYNNRETLLLNLARRSGYKADSPRYEFSDAFRKSFTKQLKNENVFHADEPLPIEDVKNLLGLETAAHIAKTSGKLSGVYHKLSRKSGTHFERPASAVEAADDDLRRASPYAVSQQKAAQVLKAYDAVINGEAYGRFQKLILPDPPYKPSANDPLFITPVEREINSLYSKIDKAGIKLTEQQSRLAENLLGTFSPVDPSTGVWMEDVMPAIFGRFSHDTALLNNNNPTAPKLESYGVRASLHNLGGINNLLGHHNSDLVLRHFTNDVVIDSFKHAGLPSAYIEAGHKGGNVTLALRPLFKKRNEPLQLVTPALLAEATREMQVRTRILSASNVLNFILDHGGTPPEDIDPRLTFADIPDPKRPSHPGISLTTHSLQLHDIDNAGKPVSGGRLLDQLANETEELVEEKRKRRSQRTLARSSPKP